MIVEDNVMPNDGTYFTPKEPVEQTISRKKERARTLEALPILKELVKHLEKRIEFYGSVDSIPDDVKKDPTKFMNMHNSNEMTRANLISEKEYIESLLDANAKNL